MRTADGAEISQRDLLRLRDRIEERTGIEYPSAQLDLLLSRLWERVKAVGLYSLLDYDYFLRYDSAREQEWQRLIPVLTVNESHFWREHAPIEFALKVLLPRLRQKDRPVRIWHAGCSRGEEPYSMAVAALESGLALGSDLELFASDIDPEALRAALDGNYHSWALRRLPEALRERYFRLQGEQYQLDQRVQAAVDFSQVNLLDPNCPGWPGQVDIIFCRHVFIYFSNRALLQTVHNFHRLLSPEGRLFLGSAESLLRFPTPFVFREEEGVVAYVKPA